MTTTVPTQETTPGTARARLTRRGRTALALASVVVLILGTASVVVLRHLLGDDCTVRTATGTLGLDRDEARRATTAVARAQLRPASQAQVVAAVQRSTRLSGAEARAVADAASGRTHASLTCRDGGADRTEPDRLSKAGLTARAEQVRTGLRNTFGDLPLGGFAPGGVRTGHMPGSAHYDGRAIDVFFRPVNARSKTRGWALAHYLVAHAERLRIDTVIYDGRIWTARRSFQGWRDYVVSHANRSAATLAILEHRDHVHLDVAD